MKVFYSSKSNIDRRYFESFISINKSQIIEDIDTAKSSIVAKKSRLVFIIGKDDTDIIDMLSSIQLKRDICVISKDINIDKLLNIKSIKYYVLDYSIEEMPELWLSNLTTRENIVGLRNINKRPLEYDLGSKLDSKRLLHKELIKLDNSICYISITNKLSNDILAQMKKETKDRKELFKGKKTQKDINISAVENEEDSLTIEEYIVNNKYTTSDIVESYKQESLDSGKSIERVLCEKDIYSREDLVDIIRNFYGISVLGKEDLSKLTYKFRKVSKELRELGVVEAYNSDVNDNTIIIIPFDTRVRLTNYVNSCISYTKLCYSLPEYLGDLA